MAKIDESLKILETELKLRGFSERTIGSYLFYNQKFLDHVKKSPDSVIESDVKGYIAHLIADRKMAPASVVLVKASLRFYYDEVLNKRIVNLRTPKNPKMLPVVLTKDEVRRLIAAAPTKKARLIIEMLYSSGIRLSELLMLRFSDLEPKEGVGWVRKGKGDKDRLFILSKDMASTLSMKMEKRRTDFVFMGNSGKHMSPRGVQRLVKDAALRAGLTKDVHPHTLRHCFATHLLESGVGIRQIQELLGHSNLQTTQIYTKVSTDELKKIKSPLDNL
jgi:integrase/recombinase XerD